MQYAVEMRSITKRFQTVIANNDVSLAVRPKTVHAIIGENGAGKTTLMNILYGLYQPDAGQILIDGQPKVLHNAMDAIRCGIGMVHQHFNLIPRLSVADNIALGYEPVKGLRYNRDAVLEKLAHVCEEYAIHVSPDEKVGNISLGMQQRVEIVKTLYRGANIIILDEPTAVLTPQEIQELGRILLHLKQKGKTILIITHKLEEVMDFSDEITVLRGGKNVITIEKSQTTIPELTRYMVGRDVHLGGQRQSGKTGDTMLELQHVSCQKNGKDVLKDISLCIRSGEIIGVAGVDGSGQTELTELIAGVLPASCGEILYQGQSITNRTIAERKQSGIGFIPQDRQKSGLILDFTLENNLLLGVQRNSAYIRRRFLKNTPAIHQMALDRIRDFDVRPTDPTARASMLSGGNQQKIVVARELGGQPQLILADQPTRGVDIGAIEAIHNALMAHRNRGGAVLLASLELDEVLMLSDRVAVMYDGRLMGILDAADVTREKIGLMMVGRTEAQL